LGAGGQDILKGVFMRVLLVDDENSLREQVKNILENQRYTVETAQDGQQALDKLSAVAFDIVILDIMMPKLDGLTVLRQLRKAKIETRVLLLTAKGDAADKVKGLDLGADDYLAKPFSRDELLARVRALLRRSGSASAALLKVQDLELDTVSRTVIRQGKQIELTPREFSLLEFLLYNKNRVVSRFSLPARLLVRGDPEKLSRAFSNIIDNALKYNLEGGRIEASVEQSAAGLTVRIGNTGVGILAAEFPLVFEQFYRIEKSRSSQFGGSGLGLTIAKRIVELHRGQITIESGGENWTQVTVFLPINSGQLAAAYSENSV